MFMKHLKEKLQTAGKSRKGFTLVEIVVVLVIIAILATLMLSALNGYIDKAKQKEAIANCRSVVLAGDTVGSEIYAGASPQGWKARVAKLADADSADFAVSYDSDCTVDKAWYRSGDIIAMYDADAGTLEIVDEMGVDAQHFPANGAIIDTEEGGDDEGSGGGPDPIM